MISKHIYIDSNIHFNDALRLFWSRWSPGYILKGTVLGRVIIAVILVGYILGVRMNELGITWLILCS